MAHSNQKMPTLLLFLLLLIRFFPAAIGISIAEKSGSDREAIINFEEQLDAAQSSEFRLLHLLAHPDRSILPDQDSFFNKTELIQTIGQFADDSSPLDDLQVQLLQKWVEMGGEQDEMGSLLTATQLAIDGIGTGPDGIELADWKRVNILALYTVGGRLLDEMLDRLERKEDLDFAQALKAQFEKVERVLAGQHPVQQMVVTNAELLDRVAGIGNKMGEKYGTEEANEPFKLSAILTGAEEGRKIVGQLVARSVDRRMEETAGVEGSWGYVKKGGEAGKEEGDELAKEGEPEKAEEAENEEEKPVKEGEAENGANEEVKPEKLAAEAIPKEAANAVPKQAANAVLKQAADAVSKEAADAIPKEAADAIPKEAADAIPKEAADAIPKEAADAIPKEAADVVVDQKEAAVASAIQKDTTANAGTEGGFLSGTWARLSHFLSLIPRIFGFSAPSSD